MPRAQAELPRVGQDRHGVQDAVQVEEWLAHAHEDDVGDVAAVRGQAAGRVADLIYDLGCLEIPPETQLSRGAERTPDRAAGLAGNAQRVPLPMGGPARSREAARRVVHEHRFDERTVLQEVECLLGEAAVGDLDLVLRDRVDAKGLVDARPERGRQRSQILRGSGVLAPHGVADLPGPIRRLALGSEPLLERSVGQAAKCGTGEQSAGRVGAPGGASEACGIAGLGARGAALGGLRRRRDGGSASGFAGRVGRDHRAPIIARWPLLGPLTRQPTNFPTRLAGGRVKLTISRSPDPSLCPVAVNG